MSSPDSTVRKLRHARARFAAGTMALTEAISSIRAPGSLNYTYRADVLSEARGLVGDILTRVDLIAPAAAAHMLLDDYDTGRPPHESGPHAAPPVEDTSLEEYVHHAWLRAHAELASPRGRTRLAVNSWTRARYADQRDLDKQRRTARDTVAELAVDWHTDLTERATALLGPTGHGLRYAELNVTTPPSARGVALPSGHHPSHRHQLATALLATVFDPSPTAIPGSWRRGNHSFTIAVPAPWQHWFAGAVFDLTYRPGADLDDADVAAHRLAAQMWSRGGPSTYAIAYEAAHGVLHPLPDADAS